MKCTIFILLPLFSLSLKATNYTVVENIQSLKAIKANRGITQIKVLDKYQGGWFHYNPKYKDQDNGGTIIQGWIREYKGAVNINWFGAIPNDNKDDTQAIKNALNIKNHITMISGQYRVEKLSRIDKITIIEGNNATFKSSLDTSNKGRSSRNILTLKGKTIQIKNLLLDGAYSTGNSKIGTNVSSLLHIYDSKNVLLNHVDVINHASNWWKSRDFNFGQLNNDHTKDMYHSVYIGFSKNIVIKNMTQRGNIKTEGLLIYESDKINIENFISLNSPKIWTSLHVIASDDIFLNHIEVADGVINGGGSSINFIANKNFKIQNVQTTTKQGFDISNEIRGNNLVGRVTRDTSNGIFENCYFSGQRALYGYPTINKSENLSFKNTTFSPTKEGYATWALRIEKAGNLSFENCIFGNKSFKTFGIIIGNGENISIKNSKFINPSIGLYIYPHTVKSLNITNTIFKGENYSPVSLRFIGSKQGELKSFTWKRNQVYGKTINNQLFHTYNYKSVTPH